VSEQMRASEYKCPTCGRLDPFNQTIEDALRAEVNLVEPEQAGALEQAFIQGAAWWEWHKEGATMWQSDRALALEEAERRAASGTLGQSPEVNTTTAGGGGEKGKP